MTTQGFHAETRRQHAARHGTAWRRRGGRVQLIDGLSRSPLRRPVFAILGGLVGVVALVAIAA